MTLLQRLGLVAWWIGAFLGGLLCCVGVWILFEGRHEDAWLSIGWGIAGCVVASICWSVAFILSGSFWRPPQ